jgi:hypothetical protein
MTIRNRITGGSITDIMTIRNRITGDTPLQLAANDAALAALEDRVEVLENEEEGIPVLELEEPPVDAVEGVAASLLFFFTEPADNVQIVSLAENFGEPDIYVGYSVDETFLSPAEAAAYVVTNWPEESDLTASHTTPPSAFVRITCKDIGVSGNDYAFDTPGGPINGLPASLSGGVDAVTGTPGILGQHAIVNGEDAYICVQESPVKWEKLSNQEPDLSGYLASATAASTYAPINGTVNLTGDQNIAGIKRFDGTLSMYGGSTLEIQSGGTFQTNAGSSVTLGNASSWWTALGGSAVGKNISTVATPPAAAWLRLNADGTVTERTAAETLSDLGGISGITNANIIEALSGNSMPAGAWTMTSGWTDNGNGTYTSSNASGYNGIQSPPLSVGVHDLGLWVLVYTVISVSSGRTSPFMSPSGAGTMTQLAGQYSPIAGATAVWCGNLQRNGNWPVHIRCENGFVGTIGGIRLIRVL